MSPEQKMSPTSPTEQAHNSLRAILLNGRILLNGNPLTASEISQVIQGEQTLFEKAMKFDRAEAIAEEKKAKKETIKNKK